MISTQKQEVVIVVSEEEVETRSFEGYRLSEIVYKDRVELGVEQTVDDENGFNNQYGNRTHSVSKPLVLREPRFVMVSGLDDILARKQREIAELDGSLSDATEARRAAEEAVKTAVKRTTELEKEIETTNAAIRTIRDNYNTLRASNAKLEGDIGKVRTAVGVLRMKEILGE
jgi:chromosome segregation ATPase